MAETEQQSMTQASEQLSQDVIDALDGETPERAKELLAPVHPSDVADIIESLSGEHRERLIELLSPEFDPLVLSELDDTVAEQVMEVLGPEEVADAVASMETDDAVDLVEDLTEADQQAVLEALPDDERGLIEQGLSYAEDSAGRLMQRNVVAIPQGWNSGQVLDYLASADDLPEDFFDVFVIDNEEHPVGTVPLSRIVRSERMLPIAELLSEDVRNIGTDEDQEDVAFLFRQRDLISAPVVDTDGRLVGAITVDDVVDVIHEEHEEDIMQLGGVGAEDDLFAAIMDTTRTRFIWLMVHLLAAIVASFVISLFASTIEERVALAILMPIVATMGGTAGIQALTVAVRAIAMKEVTGTNALRAVGKEVAVSSLNGMLFAVIIGAVAWLWFASPALGGVIALAMVINLLVAGLTGSALPILLMRAGFDPAAGSSALLTSITDVVGFYVFLALAAMLLL